MKLDRDSEARREQPTGPANTEAYRQTGGFRLEAGDLNFDSRRRPSSVRGSLGLIGPGTPGSKSLFAAETFLWRSRRRILDRSHEGIVGEKGRGQRPGGINYQRRGFAEDEVLEGGCPGDSAEIPARTFRPASLRDQGRTDWGLRHPEKRNDQFRGVAAGSGQENVGRSSGI
ncbi:hypothetical protein H6P81_000390 [Aristolochia fimbriata]|uniref:Uncharacterized protein n=1 Tax=Aristolochia fimbriata TaxID=158543 RepID=A0AAV7F7W8_ARIFI|nr:hypothetical protein H6P81_000390 [Aristolochia fimbriata]